MLANFRPPYDATVDRAAEGGRRVLIGKTNMDEFAMGSSTENSAYGPTRNPWDPDRIPGGSSGGSAAAVAADMAPLALGTDTGGSIRQPAGLCGVVGLKPTYGRVSRYGLVAFASSLDQVGPFAHDVADAALLLEVIAGHDPRDATSVDRPVPDYAATLDDAARAACGSAWPASIFGEGLDPEVEAAVREAVRVYEAAGATVNEVSLPHTKYGVPAYYLVAPAEARATWPATTGRSTATAPPTSRRSTPARRTCPPLIRMMMASRAEGFGPEVKRRIMLGTYALSAGYADEYYNKALKVRRLIRNDFDAAFRDVRRDRSARPRRPPRSSSARRTDDPLAMYLSDIYTITANLAGIPGISIPCGFTEVGPADRPATARPRRSTRRSCCGPPASSSGRPTGTPGGRGLVMMAGESRFTKLSDADVADLEAAANDRLADAKHCFAAGRSASAIAIATLCHGNPSEGLDLQEARSGAAAHGRSRSMTSRAC